MFSARKVRAWYRLHKWTSLLCTLFLLVSCLTGLPLIFHDEIDQMGSPEATSGPAIEIPPIPLDRMVAAARQQNPKMRTLFVTIEEDAPHVNVGMATGLTIQSMPRKLTIFNAYTGVPVQAAQPGQSFMDEVLLLHRGFFAGIPGKLFTFSRIYKGPHTCNFTPVHTGACRCRDGTSSNGQTLPLVHTNAGGLASLTFRRLRWLAS